MSASLTEPRYDHEQASNDSMQSTRAEQGLLGSLLVEPEQWDRVMPMNEPDFFRPDHRLIFRAITTLRNAGTAAIVFTVVEHLKLGGELENAGGLAYIAQLARDTALPSNAPIYADRVRSCAVNRALADIGSSLANPEGPPAETIRRIRARLDQAESRIEGGDRRARLSSIEVREFLSRKIPVRKHILEPPIPEQGIVMVYGPRGLGKTQVSVAIAVAVAAGGKFLKWSAPQPAGVLLIDGEMPAASMQKRLADAIAASEKEPVAPLRLITPDLNWEVGMPDLSTAAGQQAVDALVTDDIRLLIVDNLSSLLRSGVENDAESWLPLQTWALRHRAAGRSVLFIHHAGKGGAQRGTSRREDVLDTVIALRRPTDYRQSEGARFEVHFEKGRSLFGDAANSFEARLEQDHEGKLTWTIKELEANQEKQIAELSGLGMKPADIAQELGISKATVYRRMTKPASLEASGHA